jgi:hypothetical protein
MESALAADACRAWRAPEARRTGVDAMMHHMGHMLIWTIAGTFVIVLVVVLILKLLRK